jgi:hypothetical protein
MTEFMVTCVSLGIIGALTYLTRISDDPKYGWALVGVVAVICFVALYGYLYNLHHEDSYDPNTDGA